MSESIATKYAKKVANSMLTKVGGVIAGAVMDELFPPGVPDYFDEVYKNIAALMQTALLDTDIIKINGALHSIESDLKNEYAPAKQGSDLNKEKDRRHLFDLLQKYEQTFLTGAGGMLGTLQDRKYSDSGFGVFTYGASLHLAIFQEMAYIDPYNGDESSNWRKPTESSYGKPVDGTVARTAVEYAKFARSTWEHIYRTRNEAIKFDVYTKYIFSGGGMEYGPSGDFMTFSKLIDGGTVIWEGDESNHWKYEAQNYRTTKLSELTASLSDPNTIIKSWENLVENPVKLA